MLHIFGDSFSIPHAHMKEVFGPDKTEVTYLPLEKSWTTIVCLIGGGQEINHNEGGLLEWFEAISKSFGKWKLYYPKEI